jgi:hypothetical protein
MARRVSLLTLALAFVAFAAPWRTTGIGPSILATAVPMSRETEASLPGLEDDPLVRKALKCNACHVVLSELLPALRLARAKKRRDLSPDEFIGVLETGCRVVRAEYGLLMRHDKVTPVYSKRKEVSRTQGSWISAYLGTTCGKIIQDYDEILKEAAFGDLAMNDLNAAVCQAGGKPKQTNGDGDGDGDATGLRVCPNDVDWARVNTHDDGWSSAGGDGSESGFEDQDEDAEVDEDQEL